MGNELERPDVAGATGAAGATDAAGILARARRAGPIGGLPDACRPHDAAEAYAIQDALIALVGPVGGWKVGAAAPDAEPTCAPIAAATLLASPATWPAHGDRRGVEAEIAFRLARDLPASGAPWNRDGVIAAIADAGPAIEICESRFVDFEAVDPWTRLADGNLNAALVLGPAWAGWRDLDPASQPVRLLVGGDPVVSQKGGNTAGDLIRLVVWLANHVAARGHPLRAGQVVTTGSWTGLRFVPAASAVEADFPGIGTARLAAAGRV